MSQNVSPVLDAAFVCRTLQIAKPQNAPSGPFRAVCTDSRAVGKGDLFLAIKGDKFDGHDFIEAAFDRGAAAAVCAASYPAKSERPHFAVADTVAAYRSLAGAWRLGFSLPVVAVAGAVGKTTTKEMIAAMVSGRWEHVLKTEGSENGFVGIPKTLLRLTPAHQVAVIEIGIDAVGAMAQHLEIVRPTVAVVTAIAEEHMEHLGTLERVAEEEGLALVWCASRGGVAVIHNNDPWLGRYASRIGGRTLIYHCAPPAPRGVVPHLVADRDPATAGLRVTGMGWRDVAFPSLLPGDHNAHNQLAAIAIGRALELNEAQIRKGFGAFQPPYGRSQLKALPCGTRLLCDYYNASPASMRAGASLVADLDARHDGKRWACLADMLELGEKELDLHRQLAGPLTAAAFDQVLLFGPRMKSLAEALREAGFGGMTAHFESHAALARTLCAGVAAGDIVWIKGSRGMQMEKILAALEEKFGQAVTAPRPGS
jgi:UDP-N-acetylmuramoyl-tripeptide--D-alanyl-D-alanine ligase